ncbi:MAG TPA: hypothetical protein DCS35_02515, partial [Vibrio sp.]|nr:hypothetical protein [Vibrio sp.]
STQGSFDFTAGADGIKSIIIDNQADVLDSLSSGNEALKWSDDSPAQSGTQFTYTAQTASGENVFTMVFDTASKTYQFTLIKALDHPTGDGQNSLEIGFEISVVDFDNDKSPSLPLDITVIDDIPTINTVEHLGVNEDDLSDGSSPNTAELTDSGQFGTTQGADSVVKYTLESTVDPVAGLKSGGVD